MLVKTNIEICMKIAAYILTYNEEKRIADTINALEKFDEIMICDKSSTDRTRDIAQEMGAKVLKIDYFNVDFPASERRKLKRFFENEIESEWILILSTSDIVHFNLYDELVDALKNEVNMFDVMEIPMYKYSMGETGRHTFIGGMRYEKKVIRKNIYQEEYNVMIHESEFQEKDSYRLKCKDPNVAVYHLTHPTLDIIMDRHWRYAVEYVKDSATHGRGRERVMRYSVNECIRLIYRYFKRGIYKSKEVGKAQLIMLIMYNCMIFLNAFFDKEMEQQIDNKYREIREMCKGNDKY